MPGEPDAVRGYHVAVRRNHGELAREEFGIKNVPDIAVGEHGIAAVRLDDRLEKQPAPEKAVRVRRQCAGRCGREIRRQAADGVRGRSGAGLGRPEGQDEADRQDDTAKRFHGGSSGKVGDWMRGEMDFAPQRLNYEGISECPCKKLHYFQFPETVERFPGVTGLCGPMAEAVGFHGDILPMSFEKIHGP